MNARNPREDLNKAFPNQEMSEKLRMKVQSLSNAPERRASVFTSKWIAIATAACGAAAIGVLLLSPQKAAASLAKVWQTVDGVKSASLIFTGKDGNPTRAVYYREGRWRIEEGTEIANIYEKGFAYRYARNQNVCYKAKCEQPFGIPVESFKISSLIRAQNGGSVPLPARIDDNGKVADAYTVESGSEKRVFFVDPSTEMPYRCEMSYRGKDGWNLRETIRMEFDTELDPKLFQSPESKVIVNLDAAKSAFLEKLQSTRLGAIKTRKGECVIRDVQVNTSGDVFVLYTASGITPNLVLDPIVLDDSAGTNYLKITWQIRPFSLPNGESVRVQWFTPASNSRPIHPNSLRISVFMYNGQVFDATRPTSWVVTERTPKNVKMVTQDMMDAIYEAKPKTILNYNAQKPTCLILPAYAPLVDYPDLSGLIFDMNKKHERAKNWEAKQDWTKAEAAYRTTIEAVTKLSAAIGAHYSMLEFYDGLANCLEKQGRTEEAQVYTSKADEWRTPISYTTVPAPDIPRD